MKKLLAYIFYSFLILALFLCLEPVTAQATEEFTEGIYTYTVSNGEVTITDCDSSASGAITIPSALGGYPVTSIGEYAFFNLNDLTSVTIGDSVTSIGEYAFYNSDSLNHVIYGGTQTSWNAISIGSGNSSLTSASKIHFETEPVWIKNCVNVGWFCPVCCDFITRENPEDGTHSYTDTADLSCNECDYVQTLISLSVNTLPDTVSYIVGGSVDLTGLTLTGTYSNGFTIDIPLSYVTVETVDMTTAGIKIVTLSFGEVIASFEIYVHEKQRVTIDKSLYPESEHNYANKTDETKTFTYPGADNLILTFSGYSYTESYYDCVYILDGSGNQLGEYSGDLASLVVTVPGDTVQIRLTSDGSVNKYGYAFASIVAETILHPSERGVCSICGVPQYLLEETEQGLYLQLMKDTQIDLALRSDLYIDLNGFDLSGTIITNGYQIYGMDSTTDGYTCENMGTFSCMDESGVAIVPVREFKTSITGSIRRYMAIPTDDGYTFHRFYLGVTHMTIRPSTFGVGYKATFYGDEMVASQLSAFGYSLWFDGLPRANATKGAASFVSGKVYTLRVDHFDVAGYGERNLNACVRMTLTDGTVIESAAYTMTFRGLMEELNVNYSALIAPQLAALTEMINGNDTLKSWSLNNLQ